MATAQQIHANRENAQASAGPISPEGKQTSGKTAIRHGLSAASIDSFPIKVRSEYAAFRNNLEAEMLPGSSNMSSPISWRSAAAASKCAPCKALSRTPPKNRYSKPGSQPPASQTITRALPKRLSATSVPISAPLTALLRPTARQHDNNQTALCVVYAEMGRCKRQQGELQNEPNLKQDPNSNE